MPRSFAGIRRLLIVKNSAKRPLIWVWANLQRAAFPLNRKGRRIIEKGLDPYGFNGVVILAPHVRPNCSMERKSAADFGVGYLAS